MTKGTRNPRVPFLLPPQLVIPKGHVLLPSFVIPGGNPLLAHSLLHSDNPMPKLRMMGEL